MSWPSTLVASFLSVLVLVPLGGSGFNIALEHDLGTGSFVSAGAFKISKTSQKGRGVQVVLSREKLTPSDRKAFEGLVENDGYYRLRVPGSSQKLDDAYSVVASVRARCLAEAKFQEYIVLHVDKHERIFSLDYSPLTQHCRPGLDASLPPAWNFASEADVVVRKATAAPVIDVPKPSPREVGSGSPLSDSLVSGFEEGSGTGSGPDQKGGKGKKEEEKTWFEKNWMLMVFGGMLVMNVMGSIGQQMDAPPAQGAGGRPRPAR